MESKAVLLSDQGIGLLWIIALLILAKGFVDSLIGKKNDITIMDKEYTSTLKGVATFLVLIGHFVIHSKGIGPLLQKSMVCGFIGVTIFLFISGYVESSLLDSRGKSYYDHFLGKKISRIYIPWIISNIVMVIIFRITDFKEIAKGLFTFKTIYRENTYNWFILYIFYIYFFLYLGKYLFKHDKVLVSKKYLIYMFMVSVIWLVMCIICQKQDNWYVNSFSFWIGMFIYRYKDKFRGGHVSGGICFILLLGILTASLKLSGSARILCLFFCTVFTCSIIFYLSKNVGLYSKPFSILGKVSLEIFYLGTGVYLWFYNIIHIEGTWFSTIVVFVLVIVFSNLVHFISDYFITKLMKKSAV